MFPRDLSSPITSTEFMDYSRVESVQDFLIKLDMKPWMHIVEINIFSLNLVIVSPTKIMNRADKFGYNFRK